MKTFRGILIAKRCRVFNPSTDLQKGPRLMMISNRRIHPAVSVIIVLVVLGCSLEVRNIASAGGLKIPKLPFPFGGSVLDNLIAVVLAVGSAALLTPLARPTLARILGLCWNGWRGPALTLPGHGAVLGRPRPAIQDFPRR